MCIGTHSGDIYVFHIPAKGTNITLSETLKGQWNMPTIRGQYIYIYNTDARPVQLLQVTKEPYLTCPVVAAAWEAVMRPATLQCGTSVTTTSSKLASLLDLGL